MKKQEIPAFTLIECLIGLMIVSSILLSFNLLIQQTIQVSDFLQRKDQKEWLIFLAQLEEELNSSHNVSVKNQQLYYTVEDKQYIIERYQTMIRKRRTSGGHQPMLTSITEFQLLEKEHTISFYVHLENGEDGYAIWTKNDQ
ncbi:competence type IV pilus minor pilin ComGF [Enterococcus lactis]|uniref:competence type IV pilus minor pilin ComGF n=1 Tax=Enterococcus lactis TaxID=357441 RepID=UPI0024BE97E0|nr:competence type IV pilus minor pilin ComGF [Enterococcus lactis]